ncbi:hypothetical protein CEXT_613621 [Caerostris extrusa]|uniref:Uncharacterized protein n=1 Tax=Caerostris extrusa TaxID=172846 RepID=A0AAV4XEJ0_CAEEX|nr:hypothetical protein CEXT_613621 [Caerostris extrusa]
MRKQKRTRTSPLLWRPHHLDGGSSGRQPIAPGRAAHFHEPKPNWMKMILLKVTNQPTYIEGLAAKGEQVCDVTDRKKRSER